MFLILPTAAIFPRFLGSRHHINVESFFLKPTSLRQADHASLTVLEEKARLADPIH